MDPTPAGGRKVKSVTSHEWLPRASDSAAVLQGRCDFCYLVGEQRGSQVTLPPAPVGDKAKDTPRLTHGAQGCVRALRPHQDRFSGVPPGPRACCLQTFAPDSTQWLTART